MPSVTINGKTYTGRASVNIVNGKVIIDGKVVEQEANIPKIEIVIHGDLEELKADHCETITVNGSAGSVSTMAGDVRCKEVNGDVSTMSGNVHCGDVKGDVTTMSGNVTKSIKPIEPIAPLGPYR